MPKHKHHESLYGWIPGGNSFPFISSAVGSWLPAWQGRAGATLVFTPPFPLLYRWRMQSGCRGKRSVTSGTPGHQLRCAVVPGRASDAMSLLPVFKANLSSLFLACVSCLPLSLPMLAAGKGDSSGFGSVTTFPMLLRHLSVVLGLSSRPVPGSPTGEVGGGHFLGQDSGL